jgi:hypothetical protein
MNYLVMHHPTGVKQHRSLADLFKRMPDLDPPALPGLAGSEGPTGDSRAACNTKRNSQDSSRTALVAASESRSRVGFAV